MLEQYKYHTITEDIKSLIQYVQHYAIKHPVIEAANRLNKAIKKNVDVGLIPIKVHEGKDFFEEEKLQYAEDRKNHERPWELWQYAIKTPDELDWDDCTQPLPWHKYCAYRRKQSTFMPEYYSGLNWHDAEHLIGKTVECSNNPDAGWKVGKLQIATRPGEFFNVDIGNRRQDFYDYYTYLRTCKETHHHPTINIGGEKLPMPESSVLDRGTKYWVFPYPAHRELFHSFHWSGAPSDIDALQAGQVHLTEERAKAWTDWWKKEVLAKIKEIAS